MNRSNATGVSPENWQRLVDALRASKNPHEREALYMGVVAADGSPILVDRRQLREHAHFLGATGGGKISMGLSPLIEQLVSFGDSTIVIIDLKGESNELLAAASHARDHLERQRGISVPIRHFTIENGRPTCSFNPFASEQWLGFTPLQRTDVLAAASGLIYGSDFGRAFYTAVNSTLVYAAEQLSDGDRNFRTLQKDVADLLHGRGGHELPRELRLAGEHVYEVLTRLASIEQLNLPPDSPSEINFGDCFRTPQILYLKFPTSVSQMTSPAVSRLAAYFLMAAANGVQDRCQVYVIIDEFQRMAAENLSILFEQARSLDVSLILSNQSIEEVGKYNISLLNLVETNCNIRQWFNVDSGTNLKHIEATSLTREKVALSYSTRNFQGKRVPTESPKKVLVPRISLNDATYVSNDPSLSILRLSGVRHGYSQYRGLPFIARGRFHITESEYNKRRHFSWPELSDPIIDSTRPEKPHMEKDLDYGKLMVPSGLAAILIATHHLLPFGEVILVAMTVGVWAVASAKCANRYPDATKIKLGLVKTPMVDRLLRPIPAALFLACGVLSVISFGSYVASVATPILLLGTWTLMATELSYES